MRHIFRIYEEDMRKLNASLYRASEEGDVREVRRLLKAGANPNAKRAGRISDKMTPLLVAIQNGFMEVVEALVDAGADLDVTDAKGRNMEEVALDAGQSEISAYLSSVHRAYVNPVEYGVDSVEQDAKSPYLGMSQDELDEALRNAVAQDDRSLVFDLIDAGADVNARNRRGDTPLMECQSYDICDALIHAGADADAQNRAGTTALLHSVGAGNDDVVTALVSSKADVNLADRSGNTPLMVASANGDELICRILLNAGADIEATNGIGEDAVEIAKTEVIERLLFRRSRKHQRLVELEDELRGHVSLEHNTHGKKGWIILNPTSMRTLDHDEEKALAEADIKDLKAISKKVWDDVIHRKIYIENAIRNARKPSVIDDEGQYGFGFMKEGRKSMRRNRVNESRSEFRLVRDFPEWAVVYMAYGDVDGLTDEDIEIVDRWAKRNNVGDVVEVIEGSENEFVPHPEFGLASGTVDVIVRLNGPSNVGEELED